MKIYNQNEGITLWVKEQMEYMVIEDLDPRDFDPEHTPKGGATAWGLEDEKGVLWYVILKKTL